MIDVVGLLIGCAIGMVFNFIVLGRFYDEPKKVIAIYALALIGLVSVMVYR